MAEPLVADVVDRAGNALFGATVRVRDADTQTDVATALTDIDGQAIIYLPIGDYEWRAEHSAETSDWLPFTSEPLPNDKGVVLHGTDADVPRPIGYGSVEWIGSVPPSNGVDGDTWVNTA